MAPKRRSFIRRNPALSFSLAAFALIGAWLAYEVTRAITATPGRPGQYASTVESLIADLQKGLPGPDAWAEVVRVVNLAKSSQRAVYDRVGRTANPGQFPLAPEDWTETDFWPPDPNTVGTSQATPRTEAIVREIIAQARADGVMDGLDALTPPRRAVRPIPEARFIDILVPELGAARGVARLNHARMVFAVGDGDMNEFVSAFEHTLALARIIGSQSTLIDRLVGYAMAGLAMTDLRNVISDGRLDAETLRLALAVIDRNLPLPSIESALECERYFMLDTIEWTHTTSGRAIPSAMHALSGDGSSAAGVAASNLGRLANLAAVVMPSREESISVANALYDRMVEEARLPAHARSKPSPADQYVEGVSPRYVVVKTLAPAFSRSFEVASMHVTDVAGTRALIALELYRSDHGRYPGSLGDLVPGYLDAPPEDQFNPAGLTYTLRDPTAPVSRAFLLYSLGSDMADNQGAFTAKGSPFVAGEDMVYNLRRPEP
ncbi:MAG: hypothetical protein KF787_06420 [Phycisphaeraceae bacterium]|nr:hypothetical protein [Phycisphaerae bacterium]MBX3392266.1 hypothetical protein [Phycisphaeraceae bacterium]HRJ50292.1 hypothetical protein [Phycisphaerales bacterium]